MLTIYQLPTAFDLPVSVSPYCTKLEVYMRLSGHEYETARGDIRKSPNKKVPYVEGLGQEGTVAGSSGIIATLEERGPSLDGDLSAEEIALSRDLESAVQTTVYYACLYARFATPAGWAHQKATVKSLVPFLLSPILVPIIRRSQVKLCANNGFADDGGYAGALTCVERVAEALGDQPFLLGGDPHVVDCTVWANLMHASQTLAPNPVREAVRENERLMAYIDRFAERADLTLPPLR